MTRRYDDKLNKWFDEDMERCSACYLNHGHTLDKHIADIAEQTIRHELDEPLWYIREHPGLHKRYNCGIAAWIAEHRSEFTLYETAR